MVWLWPRKGADVPIRTERGVELWLQAGGVPSAGGDGETQDAGSPLAMTVT